MTAFGPWLDTNWSHKDGGVCQVRYPLDPQGVQAVFVRGRGFDPAEIEELRFAPAGAEYREGPRVVRKPNRHERRRAAVTGRGDTTNGGR